DGLRGRDGFGLRRYGLLLWSPGWTRLKNKAIFRGRCRTEAVPIWGRVWRISVVVDKRARGRIRVGSKALRYPATVAGTLPCAAFGPCCSVRARRTYIGGDPCGHPEHPGAC